MVREAAPLRQEQAGAGAGMPTRLAVGRTAASVATAASRVAVEAEAALEAAIATPVAMVARAA
jgi:hypothetical protein